MANEFIARNGIIALNDSQITGSLNISNGATILGNTIITGSVLVSGSGGSGIFSQGGTISDYTSGISTNGAYTVWRAPFSCSVVAVYGYREGGGNAQINAVKSGSEGFLLHSNTNIILTSENTWISASVLQNKNYKVGDTLKVIMSGSGGNNQIAVQVDFIKTSA
jgi:hypothetical protein